MASVWIRTRTTSTGDRRHLVEFRVGGRDTKTQHGGSYRTKRLATLRAAAIEHDLAALRVPDLRPEQAAVVLAPTFAEAAERWLASRLDVSDGTRRQQRTSINRACRVLSSSRVDEITVHDVAAMISSIVGEGAKPSYVRKVLQATAMLFDHAGVQPNPARDKIHVRLPRDVRPEVAPPTAEHVLAVHRILPVRYRLPLLVLDATGMRLGELEQLTWGDVDEPRGRWRVTAAVAKTNRARWITPPAVVYKAVTALVAREDRTPERRVFGGFVGDRFRTAVARACTVAAVPAFSPHDLRHRRISLLHLGGVPWARIGEHVGQRNLAVTANTYSHVLADEAELDYAELLRNGLKPCSPCEPVPDRCQTEPPPQRESPAHGT
jgi:integrase